jgi:hypothetical protein
MMEYQAVFDSNQSLSRVFTQIRELGLSFSKEIQRADRLADSARPCICKTIFELRENFPALLDKQHLRELNRLGGASK